MRRISLAVAITTMLAAVPLWAAAYNARPSFCSGSATWCTFSLSPKGSIIINAYGGGQAFLPTDFKWSYFGAGSTSHTVTDKGPCPPPKYNCTLLHVAIADFTFFDASTGTEVSVTNGAYDVEVWYCGGGTKCYKPVDGGLTVSD